MAIIQWDGISNFEDKIFLMMLFTTDIYRLSPQKTKPYAIVTGRKWPDLIHGRSFSHTYYKCKVPEGGVIT